MFTRTGAKCRSAGDLEQKTITGSYVCTATMFTLLAHLASGLIRDFPLAQVGAGLGGGCAA